MIEYTANDNLNIIVKGANADHACDGQNSKSFKHPIESSGQRIKSNNSFSERTDGELPAINIQGAFREIEKLILR